MRLSAKDRLTIAERIAADSKRGVLDPASLIALNLTPQEAFVLSRVEGSVSLAELAVLSGLNSETLYIIVQRLLEIGALSRITASIVNGNAVVASGASTPVVERDTGKGLSSWSTGLRDQAKARKMRLLRAQMGETLSERNVAATTGEPASGRPAVPLQEPEPSRPEPSRVEKFGRALATFGRRKKNARRGQEASEAASANRPLMRWDVVAIDENQLDDSLAISVDRQRELLGMTAVLDQLSPFELLCIEYTEDYADIRRAFHQQSRWLHPDAYRGRDLGPYQSLLEQIFARVRTAYDELADPMVRSRYRATSGT